MDCSKRLDDVMDENWRDKFFEERKGKYFGGVVK